MVRLCLASFALVVISCDVVLREGWPDAGTGGSAGSSVGGTAGDAGQVDAGSNPVSDAGGLGMGEDGGADGGAGEIPLDGGAVGDAGSSSRDAGVVDSGTDAGEIPNRVVWYVGGKGWLPTAFAGITSPPTLGVDTQTLAGLPVTVVEGLNLAAVHPVRGAPAEDCPGCLLSGGPVRPMPMPVGSPDYHEPTAPTFDFSLAAHLGTPLTVLFAGVGWPYLARTFDGAGVRAPVLTSPAQLVTTWSGQATATGCTLSVPASRPDTAESFLELIGQGLRCDLTRSVTLPVSLSRQAFPPGSTGENEIESSHSLDPRLRGAYQAYQQAHAARVAAFARWLRSSPTADGLTLLDHTLIVWLQDAGGTDPGQHLKQDLRFVIVGSVPRFRSGQHLRLPLTTTTVQFYATIGRVRAPAARLPEPFASASPISQLIR